MSSSRAEPRWPHASNGCCMSQGSQKLQASSSPAIACVYSAVPIDMILSMLETATGMISGASWDASTNVRDHDVHVMLQNDVIEITDTPYFSDGYSLTLSRRDEVLGDASPLDLVTSWRDSARFAVDESSDGGLAIIDGLGLTARLLAATGIAAGSPTVQTTARSTCAQLAHSRFGLSTPVVRTVPTPRLEAHLERVSPPFRRLGKGLGRIVTTHPVYQHCSDLEIGSVEVMRLIADLPSGLVDELRTEFRQISRAGCR